MIAALLAWLCPTAFFEPTGAELCLALKRAGYVGDLAIWPRSAGYQRVINDGVRARATQARCRQK